MANIEVYSGPFCPYCMRAKALLRHRGLDYTEYDVQADAGRREEMLRRANGMRTVPQIFINGRHVGGYDQLHALDRKGELDDWLKGD